MRCFGTGLRRKRSARLRRRCLTWSARHAVAMMHYHSRDMTVFLHIWEHVSALQANVQAAAAQANRHVLERVEKENAANEAKRAGASERRRAEEQRCV